MHETQQEPCEYIHTQHHCFNITHLLVIVALQHNDRLTPGWLHSPRHRSMLNRPTHFVKVWLLLAVLEVALIMRMRLLKAAGALIEVTTVHDRIGQKKGKGRHCRP